MKLLESIKELGDSVHDAIHAMIVELFNEDLDEEAVAEIVDGLGLTDLLALDRAYTEGDKEAIRGIIGPLPQLEYSMGRQATSQASNRPQPGRVEKPQAKDKEAPAKNVTQTNRNYNQGSANAVTTKNVDSEDDPDAVMQDPEPVEESYDDLFRVGDPIIDDQGRTGEIDGEVDEHGYVEVAFYNYPSERMPVDRLEYNDYADSEEEENDLRLSMGDDEYDRIHGDLGYDDDEDEMYESKETNVVDMIEWLQRRAGIK